MPFELFRSRAFWLADAIRGGRIRKHYREVMQIVNNSSSPEVILKSEQDLAKLLDHAVNTTSYYKDKKGYKSLSDFPVVNKSIIRGSFESFISNKYKLADLIPVVTSGSTGTPFKVYQDKNKKQRNSADTIFFFNKAGYEIGERVVYLKIWLKESIKMPVIRNWMENMIPVDVFKLNDEYIAGLLASLEKEKSVYTMIGYSSALELIGRYIERNYSDKPNIRIKTIIATSESLSSYAKETLEKYFGAPVYSRYSNLENGILAQQDGDATGRYVINTGSYKIEILKMDTDEAAEAGEPGRIVVTDKFNYGMPIIRYDTGDIGSYIPDTTSGSIRYLARVEGRKLDMLFDTKGNLVSSYLVYRNMWQYTEIIQYQFIQNARNQYEIKINADGHFSKETQLISEFKSYLGEDAVIKVEYVSEIPLLSSGKRKMVINKMIK